MKRRSLLFLVLLFFPCGSVNAQDAELTLRLRRTFGYQAGRDIQGSFSLEVVDLPDAVRVDYLIDEDLLASTTDAPFRASFSTSAYPPGPHRLQAMVTLATGDQLASQVVGVTFVTAEDSWRAGGRIAAWILGGVVLLMLIGMFGTGFLTRGKRRFQVGVYGPAGGAVCRRCHLPFSRHVLALNLMLGKLERCPHCGKVAIVPRAARSELDAAEERYRADQIEGQREIRREEDDIRQRLDDSRFER